MALCLMGRRLTLSAVGCDGPAELGRQIGWPDSSVPAPVQPGPLTTQPYPAPVPVQRQPAPAPVPAPIQTQPVPTPIPIVEQPAFPPDTNWLLVNG